MSLDTAVMRASVSSLAAAALVLATAGGDALAQEGLSSFRYIAEPATPMDLWQPVDAPKLSLINTAPILLPFVNNAPTFGVPGTVVGGFWERTQVTGDWGGLRTDWARRGSFLDVYTTTTYQDVTSGGITESDALWNNTQISYTLDTGRAGLWPGGLVHVGIQARHGDDQDDTYTMGTSLPQHIGLLFPGPSLSHHIYPSDYYIAQAFGPHFAALGGVINGLTTPDQTLFGNSYKYAFTNFNVNKSPFFANFYQPTSAALIGAWTPVKSFVLQGGVLDPDTTADFEKTVFKYVNVFMAGIYSYNIAGLPGQVSAAGNWTSKPKLDLAAPFGELSPAQIAEAIKGFSEGEDLPLNFKGDSFFTTANFSQYLYVKEDSESIHEKQKSGQPLRGIGVFGRLGYAPDQTNPVSRHASVALHGYGLIDARKYDSFGIGYYWNGTSDDLRDTLQRATQNRRDLKDEKGLEIFYDFALTPAIRLIPSYQYIWDPLLAQVETQEDHAEAFFIRATVAW
jgi:hypothetical protein